VFSNEERVAWAAGLFEGEGCVTNADGRVNLRVTNTDLDVLEQFAAFVGGGKVYGPYVNSSKDGHRRKLFFVWVCYEPEAGRIFRRLALFLSARRIRQGRELGLFPWNVS
jgi:LAGLIDADG-like domain